VKRTLVVVLGLLACGKTTPQQDCQKLADTACQRAFACVPTGAVVLFPGGEAACAASAYGAYPDGGCSNIDNSHPCALGATYNSANYNACIAGIARVACADLYLGNPTIMMDGGLVPGCELPVCQ